MTSGHDIDLYPFGRDAAPFVLAVLVRGRFANARAAVEIGTNCPER
jgi:hypothetical protein